MKLVKESLNEFVRGSDPLDTLGIGYTAKINKFFDELHINRDKYTIENKQIIFRYDLHLSFKHNLIKLPDNLTIHGFLNLYDCINLVKLPDNLIVSDYLNLYSCTSLVELPDNLTIGRWLNLNSCTSLLKLPDNLQVGAWLNLNNCKNLVELPNNLKVHDDIGVTKNQTELINWIKSSKFKDKLVIRNDN